MMKRRKATSRIASFACSLERGSRRDVGVRDGQSVIGVRCLGETPPLIYRIDNIRTDLGMPRTFPIPLFSYVFHFPRSLAGRSRDLELIVLLLLISRHEPIVSFFLPRSIIFLLSSESAVWTYVTIITFILTSHILLSR